MDLSNVLSNLVHPVNGVRIIQGALRARSETTGTMTASQPNLPNLDVCRSSLLGTGPYIYKNPKRKKIRARIKKSESVISETKASNNLSALINTTTHLRDQLQTIRAASSTNTDTVSSRRRHLLCTTQLALFELLVPW
mmetsp:Transcript_26184/g.46463  ORF Transcript_26184/g.46463 Transcript_26184/m.46463 type:complete len:138 (+) Transcript_26184:670-1083(+)